MTDSAKWTRSTNEATAVFSDAFQFPGAKLVDDAPGYIERDRVIMAARPGMVRKLLPIRQDEQGVFCGGCYLFDTWENARAYGEWVANEFILDGTHFLDRPEFLEPTSQLWRIAGTEDFADVNTEQTAMRFQRWHLPRTADPSRLRSEWWEKVRADAQTVGLTSVWLLAGTDPHHPQLGVVMAACADVSGAAQSDNEGLAELASLTSPGDQVAAELQGTKVFDRTSWIYMIWHPVDEGDRSRQAAVWPASPPLPGLNEE